MQVYLDAAAIIYINILELFALAVKIEIKMLLYGNLLESGSFGFFQSVVVFSVQRAEAPTLWNPSIHAHLHTFMASCRQGYLELDRSGNSGKLLVVLIRVRVTRCTKQASGSYDLLVIYLEQLSAEVADLFGVGAGLALVTHRTK